MRHSSSTPDWCQTSRLTVLDWKIRRRKNRPRPRSERQNGSHWVRALDSSRHGPLWGLSLSIDRAKLLHRTTRRIDHHDCTNRGHRATSTHFANREHENRVRGIDWKIVIRRRMTGVEGRGRFPVRNHRIIRSAAIRRDGRCDWGRACRKWRSGVGDRVRRPDRSGTIGRQMRPRLEFPGPVVRPP